MKKLVYITFDLDTKKGADYTCITKGLAALGIRKSIKVRRVSYALPFNTYIYLADNEDKPQETYRKVLDAVTKVLNACRSDATRVLILVSTQPFGGGEFSFSPDVGTNAPKPT